MKKVFIVHGFQGSPNGGWRPWLMGELQKREVYACALSMPDPNNPIPSEWVEEIARHVERSKRDSVYLVGHSLGVPAILRYLETTKVKNIKGVVLVSGRFFKTSRKKVGAFVEKPFNVERIKHAVKRRVIIHGDDDPVVPLENGTAMAEALSAEFVLVPRGGHLGGSSGWYTLPPCLEALEKMMRAK